MHGGFSKKISRQWVDFYLGEIQKICNRIIDEDLHNTSPMSAIELIKVGIEKLENQEKERLLGRHSDLERIKERLKADHRNSPSVRRVAT